MDVGGGGNTFGVNAYGAARGGLKKREVERGGGAAGDLPGPVPGVLARAQGRPCAAIEEALQVREITQGVGLSQHEVARRCGRDVSWVSRRLQLLSALPDAAVVAVREGRLSTGAAARVLPPLARANGEQADRMLTALAGAPPSTRELRCWVKHYEGASRV